MGPDEFATREELGVMLKFVLAKSQQQAELIACLMDLLKSKDIILDQDAKNMAEKLENSPISKRAQLRQKAVEDLAEIHKTVRQYLDPPEE